MKFIVRTQVLLDDGTAIWTVFRNRLFWLKRLGWYRTREEAVAMAKHLAEPDMVVVNPTGARL